MTFIAAAMMVCLQGAGRQEPSPTASRPSHPPRQERQEDDLFLPPEQLRVPERLEAKKKTTPPDDAIRLGVAGGVFIHANPDLVTSAGGSGLLQIRVAPALMLEGGFHWVGGDIRRSGDPSESDTLLSHNRGRGDDDDDDDDKDDKDDGVFGDLFPDGGGDDSGAGSGDLGDSGAVNSPPSGSPELSDDFSLSFATVGVDVLRLAFPGAVPDRPAFMDHLQLTAGYAHFLSNDFDGGDRSGPGMYAAFTGHQRVFDGGNIVLRVGGTAPLGDLRIQDERVRLLFGVSLGFEIGF